jgi:hypothetical protein
VCAGRQAADDERAILLAQVDVKVGRDRVYGDRRRDSDVTIGVGPGGVAVGQRCRTVTRTIQRDDGRTVTRKERRCD